MIESIKEKALEQGIQLAVLPLDWKKAGGRFETTEKVRENIEKQLKIWYNCN